MSIEPLRDGIDDALQTWAEPARALIPSALFCAVANDVTGDLCSRLQGHAGQHSTTGLDPWCDTNPKDHT